MTSLVLLGEKYRLGERIGSGGMGEVYCAVQHDLARTVAIKVMHPALRDDPTMRRRFHTEATVGGRVRHPNVVAVIDYGQAEDGTPFLVLEHARGKQLSQVLRSEGPLAVRRAVRLVADVLAGLAEAHCEGIVHADVKAENVVIDTYRDGTEVAKLIDFGLARFITDAPPDAGEATLSGTPEYLAPEVIRGEPTSCASDIYSVGVLLYELLTGRPPFTGDSIPDILCRHLDEDVIPPSLRTADRYISSAIDAIVMRALAKDPSDRFTSADELRLSLLAVMPSDTPASVDADQLFGHEPTRRDVRPMMALARRLALGTNVPLSRGEQVRSDLAASIVRGDIYDIVAGYLDLARTLVDSSKLVAAAKELEEAIDLITHGEGPACPTAPEPLWRLMLAAASIYAGLGDTPRALDMVKKALAHADRHRSTLGQRQAQALRTRLLGRSPLSRDGR